MQTDKRGGMIPLEHCYAKLQTQDGQTIDSISYDGKTGVSKGNTQIGSKCQPVQSISKPQWDIFQAKIHQQCQPENYSLENNNCCSCLGRVLTEEVGKIPNIIQNAEAQIKANYQFVDI